MDTVLSGVILVVDDQDGNRFAKVATLRRAGFQVHDASTGTDALQLAARLSPDLVVLDVNLPDINGLEVGRRLRADQRSAAGLQILQVSSTAITSADRVRGLDEGADAYLIEPIDSDVLVATVRALLRVRRAEAALARALEGERAARLQVEEASRLKDDFLATLSHELRTPLNALMGWVWQLRHSALDAGTTARALDSLERNARLQAQLINDLLDISRISKGKLHLEMHLLDMSTIVDGALDSIRDTASRRNLALRVDTEPVIVVGDPSRLHQVVSNLLSNAVQFTPDYGAISVTLAVDGEDVVVTVQDTGAGIESAFLPHVFDQFRQGEGGLSRKHGGLGLGLAVVRQLIELHGGTVSVHSPGAGSGTTFIIRMPREIIATADLPTTPAPVLAGLRICVAADEPMHSDIAAILVSSGAEVVSAESTDIHLLVHTALAAPDQPRAVPVVTVRLPLQPADLVRSVARLAPRHHTSRRAS